VWGLPASTAGRCVTLFNHINAGAPYAANSAYIFLKLRISGVGVPELFWSRFNTYNNHRMLFKISQIFCQYNLVDFSGLPLPRVHCTLSSVNATTCGFFSSSYEDHTAPPWSRRWPEWFCPSSLCLAGRGLPKKADGKGWRKILEMFRKPDNINSLILIRLQPESCRFKKRAHRDSAFNLLLTPDAPWFSDAPRRVV
jgi:hypothetical protein